MAVNIEKHYFLDYTITQLVVNELGIATRKRVADQHVTLNKVKMDKLLNFIIQEGIIDNNV